MLIVDKCKLNSFYNRSKSHFNATYAWLIIQIVANSEYLVSFSRLLISQRLHLFHFHGNQYRRAQTGLLAFAQKICLRFLPMTFCVEQ